MKTILCWAMAAVLSLGNAYAQTPAGNTASGKQLYESKGCYSCHGFVGQGSREGSRLTPAMALPAFIAQLRTPRTIMPPYTEALVSDREAADMHAYLESLPKPPDPKTIRQLQ